MKAREALLIGAVGLGVVMSGTPAWAQDDEYEEYEDSDEDSDSNEDEYSSEDSYDSEDEEDAPALSEAESQRRPGKTEQYVGARYRAILVPQFMMNLFADGGWNVWVHSFGAEYVVRKDAFEYNLALWYADYGFDPLPFKGTDDEDTEWELVTSDLKVLYFSADFLWSHEFSRKLALNYGLGAGLGVVFGDLFREQAYPGPGDDDDNPYEWETCDRANDPADIYGVYCLDPDDEEHFEGEDGYREPSWAYGGSKPVVFPWFVIQTGLRYQPHKKFVARLDVGFGTSGFFFGLGADYGL